ncbi:hypothetical protein HpNP18_14130 [Helicobacter pylori]
MNLIIKIDLFKSGNYLPLKTKIRGIFYRFKSSFTFRLKMNYIILAV